MLSTAMVPATRTNGGSFSDVPPFYEPGAPPPTLPILLAQTELVKNPTSNKLVAQQEIGGARSRRRSVQFAPYAKPTSSRRSQTTMCCSRSPPRKHDSQRTKSQQKYEGRRSTPSHRATPSESESSDSESESDHDCDPTKDKDDEDEDDDDSRSGVIPKPEGEAGRPGRGGYNLEESLEWHSKDYEHLKVRIVYLLYTLLIISTGICEGCNSNPSRRKEVFLIPISCQSECSPQPCKSATFISLSSLLTLSGDR